MNREEYTTCMKPWMKKREGGGPDRKERFCLGAKICSGKAKDEQEAAKLCAEAASNPKPPRKARGKCKVIAPDMAACVIRALGGSEINLANLTTAIAGCTGQKVEKPPTRERFIKKCFKENAVTGDIKEAQKLRTMCTAKWKEQEVPSEAG